MFVYVPYITDLSFFHLSCSSLSLTELISSLATRALSLSVSLFLAPSLPSAARIWCLQRSAADTRTTKWALCLAGEAVPMLSFRPILWNTHYVSCVRVCVLCTYIYIISWHAHEPTKALLHSYSAIAYDVVVGDSK